MTRAEMPKTMSFQGFLGDAGGEPVSDGDYALTFRIYDASTGGSELWNEAYSAVPIEGGVFDVILGSITPLNLLFDEPYWVGIATGSNPEFTPRIPLSASPYALNAQMINGSSQVVNSLEGISGTVDLVAGSNINITNTDSTITISSSGGSGGGDITAVLAGTGLSGGGDTGDVTLSVANPLTLTGNAAGIIKGTHTDGSEGFLASDGRGVYGMTPQDDGFGIHGRASASTGETAGVYGEAFSTDGIGVYGFVNATEGEATGVVGETTMPGGIAIRGENLSTSEYDGIGVLGLSNQLDYWGIGGSFEGGYVGVDGYVKGESDRTYIGARGGAEAIDGEALGVLGIGTGSGSKTGVRGEAYGDDMNYGVYALAMGDTVRGVYGAGYCENGNPAGVFGVSDCVSGYPAGVVGESESPVGTGVIGQALATEGPAYGVLGVTTSPDGFGVFYMGGISGTGPMKEVVNTTQGATGLDVHTTAGNWVEDFGEGQITNGYARIDLDPLFLETVTISPDHPMHVFLQPYDTGAAGLIVTRGTDYFEVRHPTDDRASGNFSYRIVAKKKGYEQIRFSHMEQAESIQARIAVGGRGFDASFSTENTQRHERTSRNRAGRYHE